MSDVSVASNRRIARNTLFLYVRMGLVLIVSLYTMRVVLRVLGTEDYGIYNVVCGAISMFSILNTTLSSGINRFYNAEIGKGDEGNVTGVYNAALRIQAILAVLVIFLIEVIGVWYLNNIMVIPEDRLRVANIIFQLSTITLILSIIQAPYSAAIMAYEKMDYYAIVSIIDVLLKFAFVLSLQYISLDKLLLYGGLMVIISLIDFFLYYIYAKLRFCKLKFKSGADFRTVKSMASFSFWMILDPAAYMIRGQGCNMLLNFFRGPLINAAYGISNQVAGAVDQFSGAVFTAFRPQIIQSYSSGEFSRTKNLMYSMSKINYVLKLAIAVPIIFEVECLLKLWLGEFPDFTIQFTMVVLCVKTIDTLNSPITTVMMAIGHIKTYMLISFIVVGSILPLTYFFLKWGYSPTSMYVIMLVLTVINQIASVLILRNNFEAFNIREYVKEVILPCVIQTFIVCIGVGILASVLSESFLVFIALFVISVLISSISAYTFVFNSVEKSMIRQGCDLVISKLFKLRKS